MEVKTRARSAAKEPSPFFRFFTPFGVVALMVFTSMLGFLVESSESGSLTSDFSTSSVFSDLLSSEFSVPVVVVAGLFSDWFLGVSGFEGSGFWVGAGSGLGAGSGSGTGTLIVRPKEEPEAVIVL